LYAPPSLCKASDTTQLNDEGDNAMKTNEIYQSVTDTIIQHLEDHLENRNRPWVAFGVENDYA
jgi:antirestriction protein ArdC